MTLAENLRVSYQPDNISSKNTTHNTIFSQFFRCLCLLTLLLLISLSFLSTHFLPTRSDLDRFRKVIQLPPKSNSRTDFSHIFHPSLPADADRNADRTVFVLADSCFYIYNYFCRQWYYVRCQLLAVFSNVRVVYSIDALTAWNETSLPGDILILGHKNTNTDDPPPYLQKFLNWRKEAMNNMDARAMNRIGVFHFCNERDRHNWPWYPHADFVLRNYWTNETSPHVQYVPLGGQVPRQCPSDRTGNSINFMVTASTHACDCPAVHLKPAAERRYLWSFIASMRSKRKSLVAGLQQSPLMKNGYLKVVNNFGGDGLLGHPTQDPKIEFFNVTLESQFVLCPCGNVMETHRIYDALNAGAIPVVENCEPDRSMFFPFKELLVDGGPAAMIEFVANYRNQKERMDQLQSKSQEWWAEHVTEYAMKVSKTITTFVPMEDRKTLTLDNQR